MNCTKLFWTGLLFFSCIIFDETNTLYTRFGCTDSKHNLQSPVNCLGWTPASIPLVTSAIICDGKLDTLPDPMLAYRSVISTEVRDVAIGPMIGNFPRNADGLEQMRMNTCDPDNTNKRKSRIMVKVQALHVVAMSTNVSARTEKETEEYRTLAAVIAVSVLVFVLCLLCLYTYIYIIITDYAAWLRSTYEETENRSIQ